MTRHNQDGSHHDDEMDLINAEFESMVSGLSLDESSPSTYLDELDARARSNSEAEFYALPPRERKSLHQRVQAVITTLKSWWNRGNRDDDGALL